MYGADLGRRNTVPDDRVEADARASLADRRRTFGVRPGQVDSGNKIHRIGRSKAHATPRGTGLAKPIP
jgi:hypothetical protein